MKMEIKIVKSISNRMREHVLNYFAHLISIRGNYHKPSQSMP